MSLDNSSCIRSPWFLRSVVSPRGGRRGKRRGVARMAATCSWSVALALAATAGLIADSSAAEDRPSGRDGTERSVNRYNVLFIAVDDLRPELGCYGAEYASSPHLDRLAEQGIRFTRHYVQVPTCGASRYALLTGRSPARSGVTSNNAAFYSGRSALSAESLPGAQTMPELFRRGGYRTACIGKISHTPDGRVYQYDGRGDGRPEMPHAWDALPTPLGSWKRGWGIFFAYAGGHHREDGQGHRDLMEFEAERDDDLPDGLLAEAAVAQLGEYAKSKERFFLGVGFFKPHLPFVAPRQDWEAIDPSRIPLPPAEKVNSPYWHRSGEFYAYDAPFEKTRPLAPAARRAARRAYLACVRYVDRQVGKVLSALKSLELADDTIVVVWGDHGWHLGEQRIWGKHSPFERAARSVLLVRVPGTQRAAATSDALVESLDIYPTLVDLCAPRFSRTEHPLDGTSLRPLLEGDARSVRSAAVTYWRDARSIRSDRHRLVAQFKQGKAVHTELYDLSDNVDSVEDVSAAEPEIVASLLADLGRRTAGD